MTDLNEIASGQISSPHYLKNITEFGDTKPLITTRDIYSTSKIKLLGSGARFDSQIYEKLLNHKLLPPLDQCLSVENGISNATLAEEAAQTIQQDPRLQLMTAAIQGGADRLSGRLAQIPLNPAIAFKLTVMRDMHPELFRHSLFVALVSSYIAGQMGLPENRIGLVTTAGLLHDIGIMHIDPALLERSHLMNSDERQHLYAHPLTGWMILNEYPEYTPEVSEAVLQHHEHLDGSGYPRGLKEDAIGLAGQILAVAEIVAMRGLRNEAQDRLRLQAMLKFNARRYGPQLIGHLRVFYQDESASPGCDEADKTRVGTRLDQLDHLLADWEYRSTRLAAPAALSGFIEERMHALQIRLMEAGLISGVEGAIRSMVDDEPQTCAEIGVLVNEAIWQIRNMLTEIRRRWPETAGETAPAAYEKVREWLANTEKILGQPH